MGWIITIIIGLLAGLIGSAIMRNGSMGWIKSILLGLVGSVVGKFAYGLFGMSADEGFWGQLVVSTIGACLILFIAGLFRKK
ncbi:GlsB/YeaQ/YmgE family stress response membrane protein [Porphyromonas cangingivalis]|uniref:Uncharacterized membrane protein YeaQ/YmgE, transglycosylase-associated protein family n=1 Tax=Porphyromonas cangingivalis TaxID=36874 RepID=A0A099WWE9_PORCN|nr:GlsB/YeaQ/YmgE family stress response membrane protein [Porphyromonas cangingivalis]KGL50154.1 hypothetical protein HQ34_00450 [Porphyromonas cangingivalis]KGN80204.1 hypothetical protein HQ35_05740 [Porphyromonas cangingivalis]SJZ32042.1 Uncharacterized membrane protein YeaQ/YmgE, transglycosylase-associated protein family [Porphyromonas cangingivalis]SPY35939.1 Transglycosylase associated protein [Porphyromonas cangingivalis]VEJ04561.1 Transglycosylase associated protein [Porphyromonas ca